MASSSELHDISSEPSIGEVQSPPASTIFDDREPARADVRTVPAKKDTPIITLSEVPKHVGDEVYIKFAVVAAELGTTKHGKPFAKLDLVDHTGRVEGRMWDTAQLPCDAGDVVGVKAKADEFNGQPQIIILSVKPLPDEDATQFLPSSHLSAFDLEEQLDAFLAELGGEVGEVVRSIFADDELRAAFLEAPAAQRNHHAYERGLAEHTMSMLELANLVCVHYVGFYGDNLDIELVLAGVLLHDLGKIYELERSGLAWDRSIEGELVGHITSCATLIHDACMATAASDETRRRLLHVVEAHHGRNEWGSPVEPRMWEAMIVHQVDMIDSRSGMFREIDKWSGRTWFGESENEFRREIILHKEAIAHALLQIERHRKKLERITLDHLTISVRTYNALHAADLKSAADIVRCSEIDLVRLPNFGRSMLREVKKALAECDLELREDTP